MNLTALSTIDRESFGWTVLLPVLGIVILWGIYRRIQTDWPEAYTSVVSTFDEDIRRNPIRSYLLFRAGPVVLTTLFVAVLLERFNGNVWLGSSVLILGHLLLTNGRAFLKTLKRPRHSQWLVVCLYHITSSIVILVTGFSTVVWRNGLKGIVPATDQLTVAIWSGLFTAVIITCAKSVITAKRLPEDAQIDELIKDIGLDVWNYVKAEAHGDIVLLSMLQATVLEEVRQRPRWFRNLERVKGRFLKRGTYGVAQVAASEPISDTCSIAELANKFRSQGFPENEQDSRWFDGWFNEILKNVHTTDPVHSERIVQMFYKRYCVNRDTV